VGLDHRIKRSAQGKAAETPQRLEAPPLHVAISAEINF
jgi:hypothetical protein